MKRKIAMLVVLSFLLASCSDEMNTDDIKPPELSISIGEETIDPVLGAYSWGETNVFGQGVSVSASSDLPVTIADYQEPITVASDSEVSIEFEKQPTHYSVRTWDSEGQLDSYDELDLSIHSGLNIYEILASWPEGTGSYSFYLDVE
ncbi:YajG family lipoprotein [Alkalicoccobacillus murimartini]|uniref:Lipoprotein n=1 Tax=Alkalicoccobacillus murimartini TaxID=171685 RepID=A0ABT9YMI8_9BACI|nr:hypothetical protein [Alkalicoccobacillus murimartini]MDQ0208854.1 hypothetical protein [Alkalicoccobacillus murimartini]